jgi:hypothetical protein
MSPEHSDTLLEDVLFAFSVEPTQDRVTLERYLKLYPQYTGDLIDLLNELRFPGRESTMVREDEAVVQRAWNEFAGTKPRPEATVPSKDPFVAFRGAAFVLLAQTLRIPRSVLIALRDRLVIASSIPAPFLARFVHATRSTAEDVLAYLEQPPVVAPAASYKADQKPEAPEKVSFEQLLDNSGVSAEQKTDIYTSSG